MHGPPERKSSGKHTPFLLTTSGLTGFFSFENESEEILLKISYRNLKNILGNHVVFQYDAKGDGFYETETENDEENRTL